MKQFLILVSILMIPGLGHASGYVTGTYGSGGATGTTSYGIEMGGVFLSGIHPQGGALSVGLGVSVADTDDSPPAGALLPNLGTLAYLKDFDDGNEQGIYLGFGAEIVPALFGVLGLGYSSQDTVLYGLTASGWCQLESATDHSLTYLAGIRYVREWLTIGLGYDSRRGVIINAGIAF